MSLSIYLVSYQEYADLNKNVLSDDLNDESVCFDFIWSGSEFQSFCAAEENARSHVVLAGLNDSMSAIYGLDGSE